MTQEYKVWECKIVVPVDAKLPSGADAPPRCAAIEAVEAMGVEVIGCSSGWGGSLSQVEKDTLQDKGNSYLVGISEDVLPESLKQTIAKGTN